MQLTPYSMRTTETTLSALELRFAIAYDLRKLGVDKKTTGTGWIFPKIESIYMLQPLKSGALLLSILTDELREARCSMMLPRERDALVAARDVLEAFAFLGSKTGEVSNAARDMPISRALSLLNVWIEGADELRQLRQVNRERYGLSDSATSRLISWWSEEKQHPKDMSHNYLDVRSDPTDGRQKLLFTNVYGRAFRKALQELVMSRAHALSPGADRTIGQQVGEEYRYQSDQAERHSEAAKEYRRVRAAVDELLDEPEGAPDLHYTDVELFKRDDSAEKQDNSWRPNSPLVDKARDELRTWRRMSKWKIHHSSQLKQQEDQRAALDQLFQSLDELNASDQPQGFTWDNLPETRDDELVRTIDAMSQPETGGQRSLWQYLQTRLEANPDASKARGGERPGQDISEAAWGYIFWLKDNQYAAGTIDAVCADFRNFISFFDTEHGGAVDTDYIENLVSIDFDKWVDANRREGKAQTSIQRSLSNLRGFFYWASKEHRFENDYFMSFKLSYMDRPHGEDRAQKNVGKFFTALDNLLVQQSGRDRLLFSELTLWEALRDRAILMLIHAYGFDMDQITKLQAQAYEDAKERGTLVVATGRGTSREVRLYPSIRAAVDLYLTKAPGSAIHRDGRLFYGSRGGGMNGRTMIQNLRDRYYEALSSSGMPGPERILSVLRNSSPIRTGSNVVAAGTLTEQPVETDPILTRGLKLVGERELALRTKEEVVADIQALVTRHFKPGSAAAKKALADAVKSEVDAQNQVDAEQNYDTDNAGAVMADFDGDEPSKPVLN